MTDIRWSKRKSMEYQLALFYIFFLFFFRIFTHYIGQYIACLVLGVPVTEFTPHIYKITMSYASFTFYQDFMIVISGVLANSITFALCFILAFFFKKTFNCFPRVYYKIISWIGVWTILDPIFVLITDLIARDWQHGDWFKFYKHFARKEKAQSSGIVGAYITFFMMFGMTCFNGFLFYYYMIFVHMNGRILDLYKRLSGTSNTFFMPNDNEVSLRYLQWVMYRAKNSDKQNYIITSENKSVFDDVGEP